MFTVNVCVSLYLHMLQELVCVRLCMCVSIKLKFCGCRKQVQPEGLILHIWTPLWCHCQQDAPLVSISKRGRRGGDLLPSSLSLNRSLSLFQTHSHMYLQTLTVCLSHNLPLEMICSISITLALPRSHLSFSLLPSCSLLMYVLHKGLIHALNVCYYDEILNKGLGGVRSSVSPTTKWSVKSGSCWLMLQHSQAEILVYTYNYFSFFGW